jgi:cytochrome c oxidase subunit 2
MNHESGNWMPPRASTVAGEVDALYLALVGVSVLFSILIAALIIRFAVRYRRRSDSEVGVHIHGSTWLEITWTVIPLLIALGAFAWGAKVFFHISRPPANAIEYFAVGKQWMWKFQHPDGRREINTLHVPVGQPIRLTMTSEDVIHSFFVPAFRVKMDVLPGRYTTAWFEATRPGRYHLFCAEYCGTEHARMGGSVVVLDPHEYEQWLAGERGSETHLADAGELMTRYACGSCHRDDSTLRAPKLAGLFGTQVRLQGGATVRADETYILESILNPGLKIVDGYRPTMPTFQGQISSEEASVLVRHIRGLDRSADDGDDGAGSARQDDNPDSVHSGGE